MFYPIQRYLKLNVYLQSATKYLVIKSLKGEEKWLWWGKSEMLSQRWVVLLHVMTLVENTDGHQANPWSSTNKFSMIFGAEAPLFSCFCIVGGSHRMPHWKHGKCENCEKWSTLDVIQKKIKGAISPSFGVPVSPHPSSPICSQWL